VRYKCICYSTLVSIAGQATTVENSEKQNTTSRRLASFSDICCAPATQHTLPHTQTVCLCVCMIVCVKNRNWGENRPQIYVVKAALFLPLPLSRPLGTSSLTHLPPFVPRTHTRRQYLPLLLPLPLPSSSSLY